MQRTPTDALVLLYRTQHSAKYDKLIDSYLVYDIQKYYKVRDVNDTISFLLANRDQLDRGGYVFHKPYNHKIVELLYDLGVDVPWV